MDKLIDTSDAARLLGVSKSLLEHDRARSTAGSFGVPYIRIGGAVRYDPQALLAWARARMVHPPTLPAAEQPLPEPPPAAAPRRRGRPRKAV
jgi:hypothetical protein